MAPSTGHDRVDHTQNTVTSVLVASWLHRDACQGIGPSSPVPSTSPIRFTFETFIFMLHSNARESHLTFISPPNGSALRISGRFRSAGLMKWFTSVVSPQQQPPLLAEQHPSQKPVCRLASLHLTTDKTRQRWKGQWHGRHKSPTHYGHSKQRTKGRESVMCKPNNVRGKILNNFCREALTKARL